MDSPDCFLTLLSISVFLLEPSRWVILLATAMVDVDGSCQFSADSRPKSVGLVRGLAATRRSVCIRQINRVNSSTVEYLIEYSTM